MILLKKYTTITKIFKTSNGFIRSFKERHNIRQIAIQGEQLSSDKEEANKFAHSFKNLIESEGYTLDQIYNADESGLYWKALPNKTLAFAHEKRAEGYKIKKERITLLLCSNASGSHKLPLLFIGQYKNPRSIRNQKSSLPLVYKSNKSCWMTKDLFFEWYSENFVSNVKMHLRSLNLLEKAILLLDNARVHSCNFHSCNSNFKFYFFL